MAPLPVGVALPLDKDIRPDPGIDKLRSPLEVAEITEVQGIVVTTPYRALFDLMARSADWRIAAVHASVACSAGLVDLPRFKAYVARRCCIAGIVQVRKALRYADDRVRSPPEAELMLAWQLDAGLGRPLMNWPIYDPSGKYLGAPDCLDVEIGMIGEYDSTDHEEDTARDVDADRDVNFRSVGLTGFRIGKKTLANPKARAKRILQTAVAAERSSIPKTFVLGVNPAPVVTRELRRLGLAY